MLVRADTLNPWTGEHLNGIAYPANIEQLWADADLGAIGLARPAPFVAPSGQVAVGAASYQLQPDGTIAQVYATQAAPAAAPATIPKSVVVGRIIAAGNNAQGTAYIEVAKQALFANAAAFARWIAADHPVVNADDPDVIAMVKGIGLDPTVILAP